MMRPHATLSRPATNRIGTRPAAGGTGIDPSRRSATAGAAPMGTGAGPLPARADWLHAALEDLPVVDAGADWKTAVFQRHARRQAEFALAAALRGAQMGRAIITMSETGGTSIHMFGIRTSSRDGLAEAAALWIAAVRAQDRTEP